MLVNSTKNFIAWLFSSKSLTNTIHYEWWLLSYICWCCCCCCCHLWTSPFPFYDPNTNCSCTPTCSNYCYTSDHSNFQTFANVTSIVRVILNIFRQYTTCYMGQYTMACTQTKYNTILSRATLLLFSNPFSQLTAIKLMFSNYKLHYY